MEIVALVLFLSVIVAAVMAPGGPRETRSSTPHSESLPLGEPSMAD